MVLRVEPLDLLPPGSSRRPQTTDGGGSPRGLRRSDLRLGDEHFVVLSYLSGGESVLSNLSPSESAVARAAAAGLGNAEIAAQRGCSRFTVQNQLASAYRKLGVSSRSELTALLARHGAVKADLGIGIEAFSTELLEAASASSSAEGALEALHSIVATCWSLLEQFEADGRTYLIARANPPEVRSLTPRERAVVERAALGHSNKAIAYELGLSAGTVGNYLMRAQRKLGARSRVALIRMFNVPAAGK